MNDATERPVPVPARLDGTSAEDRFGGVIRLFGAEGFRRLREAHVCVVGLGGVGSWTVEALARSGVGALTLVDLDDVCVTNVNRQLHAVDGEIGRPKAEAMARRVTAIHPGCVVRGVEQFFTTATAPEIMDVHYTYVVDAIDSLSHKCELIHGCKIRGLKVVVAGGAGDRVDPTAIRQVDLSASRRDHLLQQVRKCLRAEYGFPREGTPFGIPCVYSDEILAPRKVRAGTVPQGKGKVEARTGTSKSGECAIATQGAVDGEQEQEQEQADGRAEQGKGNGKKKNRDCEHGFGSVSFVTGAVGLALAAVVVREIARGQGPGPNPI